MAKTKAELESDAARYDVAVKKMRSMHDQGRFFDAIEVAISACDYIDGMMQYERRFGGQSERKSVETIEYILQYAPLLFDRTGLQKIETILKSQKRIEKNTATNLREKLSDAVALMWDARRLWHAIEGENEVPQDSLRVKLGGDQNCWRSLAERWEQIGLIRRIPDQNSYRLSLVTRITAEVRGKCPSCGVVGKAAMGRFLDEITCPKCGVSCHFVLLESDAA